MAGASDVTVGMVFPPVVGGRRTGSARDADTKVAGPARRGLGRF
ncbi:hypothetical protein BN2537_12389 [Streptomyces venezuelae]|nr:hypothetical protein BN2537_12389 [Streptomyces venezuelae]